MQSFQISALNTQFYFRIFDHINPQSLAKLELEISNYITTFENKYSRFIESSLVSILNKDRKLQQPDLEFYDILNIGLDLMKNTNGVFNLSVGGILENLGYDQTYSFQAKETEKKLSQNIFKSFSQDLIELQTNINVDLGGYGKGYLIDQLAAMMDYFGIKYFYINGGGDIFATSNFESPIQFLLVSPLNPKESIGKISLLNQAIASSSNYYRRWQDPISKKIHTHLIDPKQSFTNTPAELPAAKSTLAAYTLAKTCLLADSLSTAIFLAKNRDLNIILNNYPVEYLKIYSDLSLDKSPGYIGVLNP